MSTYTSPLTESFVTGSSAQSQEKFSTTQISAKLKSDIEVAISRDNCSITTTTAEIEKLENDYKQAYYGKNPSVTNAMQIATTIEQKKQELAAYKARIERLRADSAVLFPQNAATTVEG
jgi:hypothetical protein